MSNYVETIESVIRHAKGIGLRLEWKGTGYTTAEILAYNESNAPACIRCGCVLPEDHDTVVCEEPGRPVGHDNPTLIMLACSPCVDAFVL